MTDTKKTCLKPHIPNLCKGRTEKHESNFNLITEVYRKFGTNYTYKMKRYYSTNSLEIKWDKITIQNFLGRNIR